MLGCRRYDLPHSRSAAAPIRKVGNNTVARVVRTSMLDGNECSSSRRERVCSYNNVVLLLLSLRCLFGYVSINESKSTKQKNNERKYRKITVPSGC